jgi:hypothetical protein
MDRRQGPERRFDSPANLQKTYFFVEVASGRAEKYWCAYPRELGAEQR